MLRSHRHQQVLLAIDEGLRNVAELADEYGLTIDEARNAVRGLKRKGLVTATPGSTRFGERGRFFHDHYLTSAGEAEVTRLAEAAQVGTRLRAAREAS